MIGLVVALRVGGGIIVGKTGQTVVTLTAIQGRASMAVFSVSHYGSDPTVIGREAGGDYDHQHIAVSSKFKILLDVMEIDCWGYVRIQIRTIRLTPAGWVIVDTAGVQQYYCPVVRF